MLGRPMGIAAGDRWAALHALSGESGADHASALTVQEPGLAIQERRPLLPRQLDLQGLLCHEQPSPVRHHPQQHAKRGRLPRHLISKSRPSGLHLLPRAALPVSATTTTGEGRLAEGLPPLSSGELGERSVRLRSARRPGSVLNLVCSCRLILIYLIAASLPLGIFPSLPLLQEFDLDDQYQTLLPALKVGVASLRPCAHVADSALFTAWRL